MPRLAKHRLSLHDQRRRIDAGVLLHHLSAGDLVLFPHHAGVIARHRVAGTREEDGQRYQHDGDEGDDDCKARTNDFSQRV